MKNNGQKREFSLNLPTAIMLIISIFTVVVSATLGTILSKQSTEQMKDMVENKTIEMAVTAADLLDGDSLRGLKASDEGTPTYENAYRILHAFKNSNEGTSGELAFIYLCRSTGNDEFEFTIDPSDDPADFGEALEWTAALDSASKGIAAFDQESYTDRWGTFYSAYAPVFASNGDVTMIVGIDVWADWYVSSIWSNARSIIIVSSIAALSGILVGFIINLGIRRRLKAIHSELNDLETDVQYLIKEVKEPLGSNFSRVEENYSHDQVVKLREKIRVTQKEIRDYLAYTKRQAYIDSLSLVGSRTAYVAKIKEIDYSLPFCVIVYDVNGLKYINDNFGHETGDAAIKALANVLKEVYADNTIFRIGGDEFAVILIDNDREPTMEIFKSINTYVDAYNEKNLLPVPLCISQGIAFFDKEKDKTFADVFRRADGYMYQDKNRFYDKYPELKKIYHR